MSLRNSSILQEVEGIAMVQGTRYKLHGGINSAPVPLITLKIVSSGAMSPPSSSKWPRRLLMRLTSVALLIPQAGHDRCDGQKSVKSTKR